MRILEILLVSLTASAAGCVLIGRLPRMCRFLVAVSVSVAVAHWMVEGGHWQMIPAYAATGILCIVAWKSRKKLRFQCVAAYSALLLVVASVLFSFLLPIFRLPKPTGPYPVGTSILYFKDSARSEDAAPAGGSSRELMVQLWYPAEPLHNQVARYREPQETTSLSSYQSVIPTNSWLNAPVARAGSPFPVILFEHAWRGRRTNDTFLTEELASHGYFVASIDRTYNAKLVAFPDGRVVHGVAANDIDAPDSSTADRVKETWNKELAKSVADQRFILDRLDAMNQAAGTSWFGRLDAHLAGAIGFSFGGAAATAVCAEDPRVHSSVNMDGWFFNAIRERGPNQPLLLMIASDPDAVLDPNAKVETALDATDTGDVQTSLHRYGGYILSVRGAFHNDFTDQPLVSPLPKLSHRGALSAELVQNIVRTYVVAFFDKTLRGEDSKVLHERSGPFAEVSLEVWPANKNESVTSIHSESK